MLLLLGDGALQQLRESLFPAETLYVLQTSKMLQNKDDTLRTTKMVWKCTLPVFLSPGGTRLTAAQQGGRGHLPALLGHLKTYALMGSCRGQQGDAPADEPANPERPTRPRSNPERPRTNPDRPRTNRFQVIHLETTSQWKQNSDQKLYSSHQTLTETNFSKLSETSKQVGPLWHHSDITGGGARLSECQQVQIYMSVETLNRNLWTQNKTININSGIKSRRIILTLKLLSVKNRPITAEKAGLSKRGRFRKWRSFFESKK